VPLVDEAMLPGVTHSTGGASTFTRLTDDLRTRTSPWRRRLALALSPGLAPVPAHPTPHGMRTETAMPPSPQPPPPPTTTYPSPPMTRHGFLRGLHEKLAPRSYVEIGVNQGRSLAVASCLSVGVDPGFRIVAGVTCPTRLYRMPSDDYFATHDPRELYGGDPIDFAFIDGMHLAEFAYRDFVNVERVCGPASVVVFDDMLPRSADEAARGRHTGPWTGDVFKVAEVLRRRRPDLVVLGVNTDPTGVVVVVNVDPDSSLLGDAYEDELPYLQAPDPQDVPSHVLDRTDAVDPIELLESPLWARLVALRASSASASEIRAAIAEWLPR
jgi:hypothetical protein